MNGSKTWVEISKSALAENVRAFRRIVGRRTSVMAVVKSNAYGHGLVETAKNVEKSVDSFGVDSVDEGIRLRKAGIKTPILVLGYTPTSDVRLFATHDLATVVYSLEMVRAVRRLSRRVNVHIKIETGTVRQGVEGEELRLLAKEIKKAKNVVVQGVYTHFANAEEDAEFTKMQIRRYEAGLQILHEEGIDPTVRHAACSAAAALVVPSRFDLVRLGIMMYGLWPSTHVRGRLADVGRRTIQPALTWKTVIAQVKSVKKGTAVGYGLTERLKRDSVVAVLPIGYWDGYDRRLSNRASVLVGGRRCKIIGRICMNMCMADVTGVRGVKTEDEVVLIGVQGKERIAADDLAKIIGTINYEVVTRINPLIQRIVR